MMEIHIKCWDILEEETGILVGTKTHLSPRVQSKSEARLSSTQDPVLWEPLLGAADGLVLETLPGVLGLACPVSEGDPGLPTTSPFP